MAVMNIPQNMGNTDRMIRGLLGSFMLAHGMSANRSMLNQVEALVGGAFLVYGLTGFDPLLKAFGMTSIPGDSDNVANRIIKKQVPGQGIDPMENQQPVPQKQLRQSRSLQRSIADRLAIR